MAGAPRSQRTPSHLGSHHWSTGAHGLTHGQHCCPWADPCLCVSTDPGVHLDLDGKTPSQGWCWSSQMHSWTPEAVAAGWCQSHSHLAACGSSCLHCELYLLFFFFRFCKRCFIFYPWRIPTHSFFFNFYWSIVGL